MIKFAETVTCVVMTTLYGYECVIDTVVVREMVYVYKIAMDENILNITYSNAR